MTRFVPLAIASGAIAAIALSFAAVGATTTDGPTLDLAPPPVINPAPTPVPAIDATALWKKTCAKCHGVDGKADTKFARKLAGQGIEIPDLSTSDDPVDEFVEVIAAGVPNTKMKPYGKRLSADEIKALADHAVGLRTQ